MGRYHGFTCPECGSHMFGTHKHHQAMGDKYAPGTSVGSCHAHHHGPSECRFEWNRDDAQAESACMYEQSEEEWLAEQAAFRESMGRTLPAGPTGADSMGQ